MSNWEKTTRQTQDTLERLYLSAGLGAPQRSGETEDWDNEEDNGWMDGWIECVPL